MDTQKLGAFITELRKEKGFTQAQLADQLHLTAKAVSKWERGLGYPDITTLEPLAEALGVSVSELFQCRRIERPALSLKETDQLLAELAAYQREARRYRLFRGALSLLLGVILVSFALFVYAAYLYSELRPGSHMSAVWEQMQEMYLPVFAYAAVGLGVLFIRLGILTLR